MKHRPILFDLNPFHLTITAWVSILHRLSGLFIFFLIPVLLWFFQSSLTSEQDFEDLKFFFNRWDIKLVLSLSLASLCFHVLAGIRHMLMDIHIGESRRQGKIGAALVLLLFLFLIMILGFQYGT